MEKKTLCVLEIPYYATAFTPGEREFSYYKEHRIYDGGAHDVRVSRVLYDHTQYHEEETETVEGNIALGRKISSLAFSAVSKQERVLMTGGNCGHAVALAGGLRRALGKDKRIGLVWLDAHGDMNTPEISESGMIGGMPAAVCTGICLPQWRQGVGLEPAIAEEDTILTDARSLDESEKKLLRTCSIMHLDTSAFRDSNQWKQQIDHLAKKVDALYLHIDADILDGSFVPDHDTVEYGGPDLKTVTDNAAYVMRTGKVAALAVVSVYFPNTKPGKERSAQSGAEIIKTCISNWK